MMKLNQGGEGYLITDDRLLLVLHHNHTVLLLLSHHLLLYLEEGSCLHSTTTGWCHTLRWPVSRRSMCRSRWWLTYVNHSTTSCSWCHLLSNYLVDRMWYDMGRLVLLWCYWCNSWWYYGRWWNFSLHSELRRWCNWWCEGNWCGTSYTLSRSYVGLDWSWWEDDACLPARNIYIKDFDSKSKVS